MPRRLIRIAELAELANLINGVLNVVSATPPNEVGSLAFRFFFAIIKCFAECFSFTDVHIPTPKAPRRFSLRLDV